MKGRFTTCGLRGETECIGGPGEGPGGYLREWSSNTMATTSGYWAVEPGSNIEGVYNVRAVGTTHNYWD